MHGVRDFRGDRSSVAPFHVKSSRFIVVLNPDYSVDVTLIVDVKGDNDENRISFNDAYVGHGMYGRAGD